MGLSKKESETDGYILLYHGFQSIMSEYLFQTDYKTKLHTFLSISTI